MSDFFLSMPSYATAYAIPFVYRASGLEKRGRNGQVHQEALNRLAAVKRSLPSKVITVFLNDSTDVAAIRDGVALMSSHGFSDFDGIMSRTGCGAIDTSIVFQLFAAGHSSESIYHILSQESGFKALMGEDLGLKDLLRSKGPKARLARDIFSYQLVKTIGACVAALEGLDAIVFTGQDSAELRDWSYDFLGEMEFLGFKRSWNRSSDGTLRMIAGASISAYYFGFEPGSC